MRNLNLSINLKTELSDEQIRSLFLQVGYPAVRIKGVVIKTVSVDRVTRLRSQVAEQERWMESCGGDLAGYIKNCGSKNDTEYSGDGGEAIYAADLNELNRLKGLLAEAERR
jgi:hypothetical protein